AMHGCTVATRRGLAHVRVLAESFRAAHPDEPFTCLLVDGTPDRSVTAGPARLVGPPDAGIDDLELRRLALLYDADELCTALRPRLLAHLRAAHPDEVCLFLELGTVV